MTNGTVATKPAAAPHSRMTNGTITKQSGGGSLTLTYKGRGGAGAQVITIPPGTPVVTFGAATRQDLKLGVTVFVIATKQPNGTLAAANVLLGKNGVRPPM